jgi:hypothetical protein
MIYDVSFWVWTILGAATVAGVAWFAVIRDRVLGRPGLWNRLKEDRARRRVRRQAAATLRAAHHEAQGRFTLAEWQEAERAHR